MTEPALEGPRHGDECDCARCRGFAAGNEFARRHGAYAGPLRLSRDPGYGELVSELRGRLPAYAPADEAVLQLLALTLVRIKRAAAALDVVDARAASELSPYLIEDALKLQRLREDVRGWTNTALRLADALALTPTSRARLGLDVLRGEATRLTLTRLAALAEVEAA